VFTAIAMQWVNKQCLMQPVSRQQIDKHVPTAMNTNKRIELLLKMVLTTWSVQSGHFGQIIHADR
jgi:hypothetical protein